VLGVGNCDPKLINRFGTMRSGIVTVNHKMSPWVILIRSKTFGEGPWDGRDKMLSVKIVSVWEDINQLKSVSFPDDLQRDLRRRLSLCRASSSGLS
jgi:hypothetical protein